MKKNKVLVIVLCIVSGIVILPIIVVVLLILGLIVNENLDKSRGTREANTDFTRIQTSLNDYYKVNSHYPLTLSELGLPESTTSSSIKSQTYLYRAEASSRYISSQNSSTAESSICKYRLEHVRESYFGESGDYSTYYTVSEDKC